MHCHDPYSRIVVEVTVLSGNRLLTKGQNCNGASQNGLEFEGLTPKSSESMFYKYRHRTEKDALVPPPAT